jgi:enediyne biosynthesis protein E4
VTGNIYPEVETRYPQLPYKGPRIIFRNLGSGKFQQISEEAGPGIPSAHCSRGCAFGDFDNDGDLDILIMNVNEPPSLLRNDAPPQNHWLKLKLIGTKSNRSAIGSRVRVKYGVKVQAQQLLSQSSYLSSNDPRLHFGLGKETNADVEVHWPSGRVDSFRGVEADQMVLITEGDRTFHKIDLASNRAPY